MVANYMCRAGVLMTGLLAALIASSPDSFAASKQGGGAFAPPPSAKPKKPQRNTSVRRTVTPPAPVSFDGTYSAKFVVVKATSDSGCRNAALDFTVSANRTRLSLLSTQGGLLSGRVTGGRINLLKATQDGYMTGNSTWRGSANLPTSAGKIGVGELRARGGAIPTCNWRIELTRR